MKKFTLYFLIIFVGIIFFASCKRKQLYEVVDNSVVLTIDTLKFQVEVFDTAIFRVHIYPTNQIPENNSLIIIKPTGKIAWEHEISNDSLVITTEKAMAKINLRNGVIAFFDNQQQLILETKQAGYKLTRSDTTDLKVWNVSQTFTLTPDEGLYGLGQYQDGQMNYRNQDVYMVQSNTNAVVPFLVSTKGYGLLWDNYSKTIFHDGSDGTNFWSEAGEAVDYYVVATSHIDDAIAGYRKLTGDAPMLAKWAYGYWQSKEHYATQKEVLEIAKEYRKRKLPIDVIVQDWGYWPNSNYFSGMVWDSTTYPNPAEMIDQLHKTYNLRLFISVWPTVGVKSDVFKELRASENLYPHEHWSPSRVYDAYSNEARQIYWKYAKKAFFDIGIDGWWLDGTEPEFKCTDDRYITELSIKSNKSCALGSLTRYLNTYSLMTTTGIYENQRKSASDRRVHILTRSTFAGQQRNASILWSGDIMSSWKVFQNQIMAGINVSMAGNAYWTTDIGAFISAHRYPEGVNDPAFRELYIRWFQFGAFCPIFRSHGTSTPREIWQFGDEKSEEYRTLHYYDKLRYRLLPYIYSTAWQVNSKGYSFMRGLPADFSQDKNTFNIGNQYLFGKSFMVCPVTKAIYNKPAKLEEFIPGNLLLSDSNQLGLKLSFFKGYNFDTQVMERQTDVFNITWLGALPSELKDSEFSIRYGGTVLSKADGEYQFVVTSDGAIKLWIDNQLIIDDKNVKEKRTIHGMIHLKANTHYPIKLEYQQSRKNGGTLIMEWIHPDLLSEVFSADSTTTVYLPSNCKWFDFYTGQNYTGGKTLRVKSPLSVMPLFVKAGSIIPLGQMLQFSTEKPADSTELRIYTGSDAEFTIYDDQNDGYAYEKGSYSLIPVKWSESTQTLTIGERKGSYTGMLPKRTFTIVWVSLNHGAGLATEPQPDKIIDYDGRAIQVRR